MGLSCVRPFHAGARQAVRVRAGSSASRSTYPVRVPYPAYLRTRQPLSPTARGAGCGPGGIQPGVQFGPITLTDHIAVVTDTCNVSTRIRSMYTTTEDDNTAALNATGR